MERFKYIEDPSQKLFVDSLLKQLADAQATIAALQARVKDLEQWVQDQSTANLETMRHMDEMQSRAMDAESQLTQRTAELEAAANYYKQPSKNGGVYSVSGGHIGNLMDWCKDNLKHCKFSGPDEDNLDLDLVQTAQQIPQLKTELSQLKALVRAYLEARKSIDSDLAEQARENLKRTLDATTPATTKT